VHPIEQLRWVARAAGEGPALLAREAAGALATFADDPAGLVTACRRLVDRQPTSGPMWWLAARVLGAPIDATREAWAAASDLEDDTTPDVLVDAIPDDATVAVLGWPEQGGAALRRRGDAFVLVVDAAGEGSGFARRLRGSGVEAELVPESGLGAAVADSDLVLLEAMALGPEGFVAISGSRAAAATARHAGVPVLVAAGVGRILPGRLWEALVARLERDEPWLASDELVPLDLADHVAGPTGVDVPVEAVRRADCPVTPELLKEIPR
jgi:hypothetical protein